MQGKLTRNIGRALHKDLGIVNPHDELVEKAVVNVKPDEAAQALAAMKLFEPGEAKSPETDKVKGVSKDPAIAQGK